MGPVPANYYINDRAAEKLPGTSGDAAGGCPPPADIEGGYADFNVSVGSPIFLGLTGGIQTYNYGVFPYLGGGVVTPGANGSFTQAPGQSPSPGLNVGLQGNYGASVNIGRSFGECGTPFAEGGIGGPVGGSATAYYVVDLGAFVQAYYESVPYPLYMPAG